MSTHPSKPYPKQTEVVPKLTPYHKKVKRFEKTIFHQNKNVKKKGSIFFAKKIKNYFEIYPKFSLIVSPNQTRYN